MMEINGNLPSGYAVRAATPADAAGIHNLLNLKAMTFLGHPDESLEDVEHNLSAPSVNLDRDSLVVTCPDGFIAGHAMINGVGPPPLIHDRHSRISSGPDRLPPGSLPVRPLRGRTNPICGHVFCLAGRYDSCPPGWPRPPPPVGVDHVA